MNTYTDTGHIHVNIFIGEETGTSCFPLKSELSQSSLFFNYPQQPTESLSVPLVILIYVCLNASASTVVSNVLFFTM